MVRGGPGSSADESRAPPRASDRAESARDDAPWPRPPPPACPPCPPFGGPSSRFARALTPRRRLGVARALPSGPSGAAGGCPFSRTGASRVFVRDSSWPLRATDDVRQCVGGCEATTVGTPRASWRLLLAVRGRRGLPNPRRDPRRGPRDAPRAPRRARPQSSGGPPRFGSRMPRNARRRRPRRVTTARRSDVSSAPSRSPSCTPPPSPPWAAR